MNRTSKKNHLRILEFFLAPKNPTPLAILRIGLAIILLLQLAFLKPVILVFFSASGLNSTEIAQYFVPLGPTVGSLERLLSKFGIMVSDATFVDFVIGFYAFVLVFLAVGFFTRPAALFSWFIHWTLMNTSEPSSYGLDTYAHVFLFYLVFVPSGDTLSLDNWIKHRSWNVGSSSSSASLGIRILQIHLCISYFSSALMKAAGMQWINGDAIWRVMSLPHFQAFDLTGLAFTPYGSFVFKFVAWSIVGLELGYSVFIWRRQTRVFWLSSIIALHLAIAIFLRMALFSALMCILNISLFGIPNFAGSKSGEPRS